jgi:NAD(P)-dependent dehydrogenase (short-subunit alcohol dehydrogenase family)
LRFCGLALVLIAPGYIDTLLLKAAFADQYERVVKAQAAILRTKRIGTAQATAKAVVFLMTNLGNPICSEC